MIILYISLFLAWQITKKQKITIHLFHRHLLCWDTYRIFSGGVAYLINITLWKIIWRYLLNLIYFSRGFGYGAYTKDQINCTKESGFRNKFIKHCVRCLRYFYLYFQSLVWSRMGAKWTRKSALCQFLKSCGPAWKITFILNNKKACLRVIVIRNGISN